MILTFLSKGSSDFNLMVFSEEPGKGHLIWVFIALLQIWQSEYVFVQMLLKWLLRLDRIV